MRLEERNIKTLTSKSGIELELINKIGEGGQGIVYKVKDNYGKEYALKWYILNKLDNKEAFYENLQNNILEGSPDSSFLWPLEIIGGAGGNFGYIMDLKPDEYKDFSQFLLAKESFANFEALINAAIKIVRGFRALHNKGYSYQDINDGNFFINPETGDVLICDNDNVAPYGENLGIKGKCRYMAPEIVTGGKKPDIQTDRFSLAVILYLLLLFNHPLEGQGTMPHCLTEENEDKYYGSNPIFVWDAENEKNRPVKGVHSNQIFLWDKYPEFLKKIFLEAFSQKSMVGEDINRRIPEKKWEETLIKFRDYVSLCNCGNEVFIEDEIEIYSCEKCGYTIQKEFNLRIDKYKVPLIVGNKIYSCHFDENENDMCKVSAIIVASKSNASVLGVKIESESEVKATLPNGKERTFNKGEVIKIVPGMNIVFDNEKVGIIE